MPGERFEPNTTITFIINDETIRYRIYLDLSRRTFQAWELGEYDRELWLTTPLTRDDVENGRFIERNGFYVYVPLLA